MVDISISELIVDLLDHKVLGRLQSLFGCDSLEMVFELGVHLLEDPHTLLVPIVNLSQQREIIGGVLIE